MVPNHRLKFCMKNTFEIGFRLIETKEVPVINVEMEIGKISCNHVQCLLVFVESRSIIICNNSEVKN